MELLVIMNYLIELARSQATKDMEKKVGKATTIGAGLAAAGTLGMGLYNMKKGKFGAFKPKVDKKLSESLAQAEKTRKAMQARNINFENMNMNHFAELRKYNHYDDKKVKRYRDLTDKEKNEMVPAKPFSRGSGAAAALAAGGLGGYYLGKRSAYNRRLNRVNQRQTAMAIKDVNRRNKLIEAGLKKTHKSADKLAPKVTAEKNAYARLMKIFKK